MMKILFFLVVIANVALFMWEYKTGAFVRDIESSEPAATLEQEPILLVSELQNNVQGQTLVGNDSFNEIPMSVLPGEFISEIAEGIDKLALGKSSDRDSKVNNPENIAAHCYEVGPFTNKKLYQRLVKQIKAIESQVMPITREEQIPGNYMVYYPAANTDLETEDTIRMLKSRGIKDLWLLSGEDKGKISLGLFIKEVNALTMKNELLAKGINAEVEARYKTKSQKYVLIRGDDKLIEHLDVLNKTYPGLLVKQMTVGAQGCQ